MPNDDFEKMMRRPISRGSQGLGKKKPRYVRTPIDLVKGAKARREYTGVDPTIRRYFIDMSEEKLEIPTLEELRKLPKPEAQDLLEALREKHVNKDFMDKWDIKYAQLNAIFKEYGVLAEPKGGRTATTPPTKQAKAIATYNINPGVFSGEEVENRLLALSGLVSKDRQYRLVVTLEELDE